MKKTRELIAENLALVDGVVELCDARIPISSRNPLLDELVAAKTRLAEKRKLVLNKSDLADEAETKAWCEYFRGTRSAAAVLAINAEKGDGNKKLVAQLEKLDIKRFMVIGVPNVGKSSLINRLADRRATGVGDRPGFTRGKQWLTTLGGLKILDTPGVLWTKIEEPRAGLHLAFCGAIKDETLDIAELALELLKELTTKFPNQLAERYGFSADELDAASTENGENTASVLLQLLEELGRKRGYLLSGGKIDIERTARTFIDEFRSGKIGRITLEKTEDFA